MADFSEVVAILTFAFCRIDHVVRARRDPMDRTSDRLDLHRPSVEADRNELDHAGLWTRWQGETHWCPMRLVDLHREWFAFAMER